MHGSLHKVLMDPKSSFFLTFVIVFSLWSFYNKRYIYFIISQEEESYVEPRENFSDIYPENIFSSVAPQMSRKMNFSSRAEIQFKRYKAKDDLDNQTYRFINICG